MNLRSTSLVAVALAIASLSPAAQVAQPPRAAASPQLPPRDQAPPAASGQGILRGRITRLDNGQPLRHVLITITSSDQPTLPTTFTDNDGRFELTGLASASYTITASKGGFVTLQYGQRGQYQPGRPVALAAAAVVERLDFALTPAGVIAGRIVDEDGDPVPNVWVQAVRQRYLDGRPLLSGRVVLPDTTDDHGEFRIYAVPPGTYYVSATGPTSRELGLSGPPLSAGTSPSFYPGTSSPETAQPINVAPGQEVAGLSFALVRAATATVTAVVRTPDGQPLTRTPPRLTQVRLTRALSVGGAPISNSDTPGPDGSVSWKELPPGEYLVSATTTEYPASATARSTIEAIQARVTVAAAATRVTLAGADVRVELTLQKPEIARGRITLDADASPGSLRLEQVRVRADSFDLLERSVNITEQQRTNADGTFETAVTQDARLLRLSVPAGWAVKSIRMGDADVTDTPLPSIGRDIDGITILLTDRLTEISGVVRDGNGKPVDDATVVLFADDPGRWRYPSRFVAAVRADQNGRFSHRGLPPARYVAVALDYLGEGEETNPELLRRLQALGARFALAERQTTAIDLTLSTLP